MERKRRKSSEIALGGVFSGLCLLMMFLTGLIPFATYALPALAGAMLIPVIEENGTKIATLVYVSVVLLAFVVPDPEAAAMFICFFGYYPILKVKLEKLKWRPIAYMLKFAIFSFTMVAAYYLLIHIVGMPDLAKELGEFGRYSALIFLGMGCVVFWLYDLSLTRFTIFYKVRLRGLLGGK